jgi:hypothetical protein
MNGWRMFIKSATKALLSVPLLLPRLSPTSCEQTWRASPPGYQTELMQMEAADFYPANARMFCCQPHRIRPFHFHHITF